LDVESGTGERFERVWVGESVDARLNKIAFPRAAGPDDRELAPGVGSEGNGNVKALAAVVHHLSETVDG